MDAFATDSNAGTILSIRVTPRAGRTRLAGMRDGVLRVALAAAPVEGAANAALVAWLAECLNVPRRRIRLLSGVRHRSKRVEIEGVSASEARARLSALVKHA